MTTIMASMEVRGTVPPVLQSAHLRGRISGLVAFMTVEHCYRNASKKELEITYTFPMPPEAVLTRISLKLNGQSHLGVVKEKNNASADYDLAIEDGDSAVLVEQAGPGLYTATLGNLLPAEEAHISYEWVMPLTIRDGTARISIPTAVKDRFGDSSRDGKVKPEQATRQNALVEYPFTVEIEFDESLSASRISCPDHDTAKVEKVTTEGRSTKRLVISDGAFLDRNLYIVLEDCAAFEACTLIDAGDEVFFHATSFSPLPKLANPVSIKLLIDCSGSMQDENAIGQARNAAATLLQYLSQIDFASISYFGGHTFHSVDEMLPVTPKNFSLLSKTIGGLAANLGGTELEAAMVETLRKVRAPETAPTPCILLVTDGASWAHRRIVRAATKAGCKVFCIGVGSNPAESLLHEIAMHTDGDYTMLAQGEDLKQPVVAMLERMRQTTSWKVKVDWGDKPHRWVYPSESTPVYADEQLHIFGRTRKEFLGEEWEQCLPSISLTQTDAVEHPIRLDLPAQMCETQALGKLIAQREMMCSGKAEALDIAIRHQLISEQTSMIIVHERDIGNKALGVPEHSSVDQMKSTYVARADAVFRSGPRFAREEYIAFETPVVCRMPSQKVVNDQLEETNLEHLEIPEFLTKDDDTPLEKIVRRIKRVIGSDKGGEVVAVKGKAIRIDGEEDGTFIYATPQEILNDVNRIAAGFPYTKATFRDYFSSIKLPLLIQAAINQSLSNTHDAVGIFFIILNSETGGSNLQEATLSWLKNGLASVAEKDSLATLTTTFSRLLVGVSLTRWPRT